MDVNNSSTEYYCEFDNDKLLVIKNLSYDIKNAINGLSGFINLLDKCIADPAQKELLDHIKYSDSLLNYLSDSLVKITREDNNILKMNSSRIKLKGLLIKSLMLVKRNAEDKNNEIKFNYDENIPEEIYGNGVKLLEIINNLLEHCVNTVDNGVIDLEVFPVKEENGLAAIEFKFVNTGVIPLNVKTIFEFENYIYKKISLQAERGTMTLPLAIANELVKQCGSCLNYTAFGKNKEVLSFVMNFSSYPRLFGGGC